MTYIYFCTAPLVITLVRYMCFEYILSRFTIICPARESRSSQESIANMLRGTCRKMRGEIYLVWFFKMINTVIITRDMVILIIPIGVGINNHLIVHPLSSAVLFVQPWSSAVLIVLLGLFLQSLRNHFLIFFSLCIWALLGLTLTWPDIFISFENTVMIHFGLMTSIAINASSD